MKVGSLALKLALLVELKQKKDNKRKKMLMKKETIGIFT
jgi:hypothetical protein